MTSERRIPYAIGLAEAARRLGGVSTEQQGGRTLHVALPASYAKRKRQRYPLLLVLDCAGGFGTAVEMSRLMAETKEVRECIVVGVEGELLHLADLDKLHQALTAQILPWCLAQYRVDAGQVAVFGAGMAGAAVIRTLLDPAAACTLGVAADPDLRIADEVLRMRKKFAPGRKLLLTTRESRLAAPAQRDLQAALVGLLGREGLSAETLDLEAKACASAPSLVRALLLFWGTGVKYGKGVAGLHRSWAPRLMGLLSPLLRGALAKLPVSADTGNPYQVRAQALEAEAEVFVSLPPSFSRNGGRRYPALFVLDANIEFSTVAEIAACLAADGAAEELIVVGVGVPRAQGRPEFVFRRFEDFSPPAEGYAYDDDLGRIFLSLFASRGQDARQRMGRAPQFYRFLVDQLIPQLAAALPLDSGRLGLMGHSAGGTFVGYALHQSDTPFRHYLGISPGIGISGSWLMRMQDARRRMAGREASVFLSVGSEEMTNMFNQQAGIPETPRFAEALRQVPGLTVQYHSFEGETHSSTFPRAVQRGLAWAYGRTKAD